MKIKRFNLIFAYLLFGLGAVKLIFFTIVFSQYISNIQTLISSQQIAIQTYPIISNTIGYFEIFMAMCSLVMVFLNLKDNIKVIPGYLFSLLAFVIEYITPSFLYIFGVILQCVLYMKAGSKIKKVKNGVSKNFLKIKKDIKNTEWFYGHTDTHPELTKAKEKILNSEYVDREFIEDNFSSLVLILGIGLILSVLAIFCYNVYVSGAKAGNVEVNEAVYEAPKVVETEKEEVNLNNDEDENIVFDPIDMSEYYLEDEGEIGQIYNSMVDEIGKSRNITRAISANNLNLATVKLDLGQLCSIQYYDTYTKYISYPENKMYKILKETKEQLETENVFTTQYSEAEFVNMMLEFNISTKYTWEYSLEKDVTCKGKKCNLIKGKYSGFTYDLEDDKNIYLQGEKLLYIEVETNKLLVVENVSSNFKMKNSYEYDTTELKLPQSVESYFYEQ